MITSSLLPSRFGGSSQTPASSDPSSQQHAKPNWLNRHVSPLLQGVTRRACTHPVYTIVFVAALASTTYKGILENSFFGGFENGIGGLIEHADLNALLEGSRTLTVGPESEWSWRHEDGEAGERLREHGLALLTLDFSDSPDASRIGVKPSPQAIAKLANDSATILPSSLQSSPMVSPDAFITISVPFEQAAGLLSDIQEVSPASEADTKPNEGREGSREEGKTWIMKDVQSSRAASKGLVVRSRKAYKNFLRLLKSAETPDIIIMFLGYLAMHLTFVSLFMSMRRLGSKIWLASMVLISSVFAFLLGLTVTNKLGVPINVLLLSEGLPFLVVIVGFEKPIVLTKSVLSAALDSRRPPAQDKAGSPTPLTIQGAVQKAVRERGAEIIKDYCIEIVILAAGAASGVQGGLRQFCFLGAWILFFDCVLLFTFYTAVLTIKVEINRIKHHVALRKALEDDGVSRSAAEKYAAQHDWPPLDLGRKDDKRRKSTERTIFGRKIKADNIPKFKVLMVSGFILVNFVNICAIPFRADGKVTSNAIFGLSNVPVRPPIDAFNVAGAALAAMATSARSKDQPMTVTVLSPVQYQLEYPSVHFASQHVPVAATVAPNYTDQLLEGMGGKVVEGLLTSLKDPALSQWIIALLVVSVVLNGYLFNAARWTIKDPPTPVPPPSDREVMDGAATPISRRSEFSKATDRLPLTPSATEDGSGEESNPSGINSPPSGLRRTYEECEQMLKDKKAHHLHDEELIGLCVKGKIKSHLLEKLLGNKTRAVRVRRGLVSRTHATRATSTGLETSLLPYEHYNYDLVHGACCENVIGYLPLPLGVAGPISVDGQNYWLPMATTEGVLVASTNRGAKAINQSGGARTVLTNNGMTRGPCVGFSTMIRAAEAKAWVDSEEGHFVIEKAFNSTSRFARLKALKTCLAGNLLFIRFKATTGDAMGMNMISKGVEKALQVMATEADFDDMSIISISGNYCVDKKSAAINWIDGRGKGVVAEAIISKEIVKSTFHCDVASLVELNTSKNLIGSAMAGSIGGFNAQASNIVSAVYLAAGQDPAQNVESSNCITIMKKNAEGHLQISVSMPSIEVGTIGGGTILEAQSAVLDLLGVRGSHPTSPGENAERLARIVAAGVLAGELSLCGALAAGHLVQAHMAHNRSQVPSRSGTPGPPSAQTAAATAGQGGEAPSRVGSSQHLSVDGAGAKTSGSGAMTPTRTAAATGLTMTSMG